MNQPIQENKEKCCEFCLECPDYTEHNFCHDKECKCHIPQPKEVQNTSREEIRERFQANMLDGDDINDCGGAMLEAKEVFEYFLAEIEAEKELAYSAGQEAEMVRIKKNISMLRQWLNEDRITDKKMVTNEEIETWLSLTENNQNEEH